MLQGIGLVLVRPGDALHVSALKAEIDAGLTRWRERWRFREPVRVPAEQQVDLRRAQSAESAVVRTAFDVWAEAQHQEGEGSASVERAAQGLALAAAELDRASDEARDIVRAAELGEPEGVDSGPGQWRALPDELLVASSWKRLVVGAWRDRLVIHSDHGPATRS